MTSSDLKTQVQHLYSAVVQSCITQSIISSPSTPTYYPSPYHNAFPAMDIWWNSPMTKRGPTDVCQNDWRFYLVKRFEDRDMLMRYLQQGIGHMFTGSAPKNNNADYVVDESEAYITEDTEDTSSEKDQNNDPGTRKLTWTLEEEEPDFEGNSDSESTKSEYLSCQAAWVLDKIWSRKLTLSKDYIPI